MQVNSIILSKDRPAQLHLCLESIQRNGSDLFNPISVVYYTSDMNFKNGYDKVAEHFPTVSFIHETSYYEDIIELVDESLSYTVFFTDDDIFYRKLLCTKDITDLMEEATEVSVFSFRLGVNTYIQDPYTGSHTIFPTEHIYDDTFLIWGWNSVPNYMNFGYPLSVDGHIFRTSELKAILTSCKFNNPNQQEIAMMSKMDMINKYMACCEYSHVVNTPLNRVQSTCMNRAGESCGQDAETMNLRYLAGEKLDLDSIDFSNIIGCHQELEIKWTTR